MSAAPVLSVLKNGREVKSLALEGEVVLGRAEQCDLQLDDRAISRQHAVFRSTPSGVEVFRKSDFAPLLVNGVDCTSALLREGDIVQVGPYRLKLSEPAGASSKSPVLTPVLTPVENPPVTVQAAVPDACLDATQHVGQMSTLELGTPTSSGLAISEPDATVAATPDELIEMPAFDDEQEAAGQMMESPSLDSLPPLDGGEVVHGFDGGASAQAHEPAAQSFQIPDVSGVQSAVTHKVVRADSEDQTMVADPRKILQVGLVVDEGLANVTHFELDKDEVSLGRDKSCDIVLNDKKSSRRHAIVVRAGLRFVLKDLASANGLYLNGAPVKEQELFHGDKIRIGTTVIEFRAVNPEYARREKNFMKVPEEPAIHDEAPEPASQVGQFGALGQSPLAQPIPTQPDPMFAHGASFGHIPGVAPAGGTGLPPPAKLAPNAPLLEKFKALPMKRKVIWVLILAGLGYELLGPDDVIQVVRPKKPVAHMSGKPGATASLTPDAAFEALSPENKKFVQSQYELARTHFAGKEYGKAIFEIQSIFRIVPEYLDARDIERYAIEGKNKLEALEEEQRKKVAEEKLHKEVEELVAKAADFMKSKKYELAKPLFSDILSRDPENKQVAMWRQEIEGYETKLAEQAKIDEVRRQVNEYAWTEYRAAHDLQKGGHCKDAIDAFEKVAEIQSADLQPQKLARAGIVQCQGTIHAKLEPILQDAHTKEQVGELKAAYELYRKATQIDADDQEGFRGMDRIRGAIEMHAKETYTEAVLAESYSDFSLARKKYRETMDIAPQDNIYFERAQRKLNRWVGKFGEDEGGGSRSTASDGSAPAAPPSP